MHSDLSVKALRDVHISDGYVNMFPIARPFSEKLVDSLNSSYESVRTDGQSTVINNGKISSSYTFVNEAGVASEKDYLAAMTMHSFAEKMRIGKTGTGNSLVW